MKTEFAAASPEALKAGGEIIHNGGLVAFPTETVYGIGANALDADAAMRIYAAKGRPSDNPLIVHVADPEEAEQIAHTSEAYYRLAELFMPGPLTVILPKKDVIPASVTGGLDTVAVRCPRHEAARELIRFAGVPVAAPSANLSGSPSPTTAAHVAADLDGRVDMIIDGGPCEIGLESSVIALDGDVCTVLRPGGITPEELRRAVGEVIVAGAVTVPSAAGDAPRSPGMKYKHYAPKIPFILLDGSDGAVTDYINADTRRTAVLAFTEDIGKYLRAYIIDIGSSRRPAEQMHRLFDALRECESCGAEAAYAKLPSTDDSHLALYNRMIRACGGNVIRV